MPIDPTKLPPDEAQRALLLAVARGVAKGRTLDDADKREVEKLIAVVDAKRLFMCREHGKQFSSSQPCPACAGAAKLCGFVVRDDDDGAPGAVAHVVAKNGYQHATLCGLVVGKFKIEEITSKPECTTCCRECVDKAPASVWSAGIEVKP